MTETDQAITQVIGTFLAAITGTFVAADAKRRGLKESAAFGWGVGVFFLMILFLPLYLYLRKKQGWTLKPNSGAAPVTAECPYCGYANAPGANYCAKCDRQLKGSGEIHQKGGQ